MTEDQRPDPPADAAPSNAVPADAAPAAVGPTDPGPTDPAPGRSVSRTRSLVEWAAVIIGAILIALAVRAFVLQPFYIPSVSMTPTLQVEDRVLVNKMSYRFGDVSRGDIVVFERPEEVHAGEIKDLIKRVVGLPGNALVIKDGRVYVDGTALDESYLPAGTVTRQGPRACTEESPCIVPQDTVWVMGDNRGNSEDSRWFGPIPQDDIVGRAFFRMWPLGEIGFL